MEPAESIAKLGFSRWYERQLIESHAYLVTSFLCLITVLAGIEEFNPRAPGFRPLALLALIAGAAMGCAWSCKRYLTLLAHAEHVADKSTCEKCRAYAAFAVTASGPRASAADEEDRPPDPWFSVRCRKCGHEWTIR